MAFSAELAKALNLASESLSANADGELALSCRKRIWTAFGPLLMDTEDVYAILGVGLFRRTTLAILCARHMLDVWEQELPENKDPHHLLEMAERYMKKLTDLDTIREKMDSFWVEIEALLYEREDSIAVCAGLAAYSACRTAVYDEDFEPDNVDDLTDDDLEPYDWDAGYLAALVYAGGGKWNEESNATQRRQFWEWYLKEAVPKAWNSAQ